MELWHGSEEIVRTPRIELCRPFNDYGAGFYCTHSPELAQEWAARSIGRCAFANLYELDTAGLKMLDLEEPNYNVLNWLAMLLEHRNSTSASRHILYHSSVLTRYLQLRSDSRLSRR